MFTLDEALARITQYEAMIRELTRLKADLQNSSFPPAQKDEQAAIQQKAIEATRAYQQDVLRALLRFPPHKVGHFQNVQQFHAASPFERSVFVMTKFPNKAGTPLDLALGRVIKTVRDAIDATGHRSHLASDKDWSPALWENVETYLMACGKAVAIVESKHSNELNPNVTMEWGWMRGTERRVLFLVEKTFDKGRADLSGLTREEFDWENPEPDITAAVAKFLA